MNVSSTTYDAIVIGSGISGGWAAKELCEAGLKTLVLERGRDVQHITDYSTALSNPWDHPHRLRLPKQEKLDNPIATKCYAYDEATRQFFVPDAAHPYIQEKPFDWIRGYQVGGKSLIWARQVQRWSDFEFSSPQRDGYAVDWPIRYHDLAPWYSHVEKFIGVSGNRDQIDSLPDGEFLPPFELNCVEKHIQSSVKRSFQDRQVIIGRCAHLTAPQPHHTALGRSACQSRHLCYRGCPYGAYFSSNSATLPAAHQTGNLTLRPHSVVHSLIYDDRLQKATGVRVIDGQTGDSLEFFAKIIFVNAACLNTNLILLNSTSSRFPNGLGNDYGHLGRHIAFHNYRGQGIAQIDGFKDRYYFGRRPTTAFVPSFRNLRQKDQDFLGSYMMAFSASRPRGKSQADEFGANLKSALSQPADHWQVYIMMQGETIPRWENHVRLSTDQKDPWGIPQLITSVAYTENDEKMVHDFQTQAQAMLEKAGCRDVKMYDTNQAPGLDIHEMGGARMGHDPKTSILNAWNQIHSCPNVFVTDGAAMTSTGNQNPSLTFMALTARAVHRATTLLKRGDLR